MVESAINQVSTKDKLLLHIWKQTVNTYYIYHTIHNISYMASKYLKASSSQTQARRGIITIPLWAEGNLFDVLT